MGLHLLDIFFTLFHLIVIGFNLLGWIWKRTRKLHLICVAVTASCWFILGIWFGIGYCPVTDWHWQIKEKLGGHNLPGSFIGYYADQISGTHVNDTLIDWLTGGSFFAAAVLSVYVNFLIKRKN